MSSTNMFALLNDSDSDDEGQPKQQQSKPVAAPVERKPERKAERKPRNDRPRAERDDRPYDGSDKIKNPADDRREGGKGRNNDRREGGKGKGRKGESRGDSGREYPRRSGTGRGRENNRQGSGKYNWGKDTDGQNTSEQTEAVDGEEPAGQAEAPAIEEPVVQEEEDTTIGFDEWEAAQADKMASLNSLNNYGEREVEDTHEGEEKEDEEIEVDYQCMFHDSSKNKKDFGKKQARDGYKQADQVLNLKFVDEDAGAGKGKSKGSRQTGKGSRKGGAPRDYNQAGGNKSNIDLSNDAAFPTLGQTA